MKRFIAIPVLGICSLAGLAHATTISYPNFNSTTGLTINGAAAGINSGGQGVVGAGGDRVLRLANALNQGSSAFTTQSVSLANESSFSTFFAFQITSNIGIGDEDGQGADGLCFVVQTVSNTSGGIGGGIGYAGIDRSVAVEFDTYNNGAIDSNNGNHVGVDVDGSVKSVALQTLPTGAGNADRLNNGAVWFAWVDYNGVTNDLEVRLASTTNRPAGALLSYNVDLVGVLQQSNAFVGFTAGTGAGGGNHDIIQWQFENDFRPFGVPLPSAAALGIGVFTLAAARRRR